MLGFEEYRARMSRGLPIELERWDWIPHIEEDSWFKRVGSQDSSRRNELSPSRFPNSPLVANVAKGKLDLRIGGTFDGFHLVAMLGRGAFSEVFLATQPELASRYVALKIVRRTLNEPGNLARLQHTGIIPLYSIHRIREYTALCMPYFGAATLADWFRNESMESNRNGQSLIGTVRDAELKLTTKAEDSSTTSDQVDGFVENGIPRLWSDAATHPLQRVKRLSHSEFISWFAQRLAAALAHAHDRDIVHGDLKPANILLKNDGEPALIDFNLSRDQALAQESWVGGTLPYMAPEQMQSLLGRKVLINPESDIYSLGIILYELVEGRLPFESPTSSAESDLSRAIEARKDSPRFASRSVSAGMKAIIAKCLEHDPSNRYRNGSLLLEDVERERSHQPLKHAKEPLLSSRIRKIGRRYPKLFSVIPVAMLSSLLIALFACAAVWQMKRADSFAAMNKVRLWRSDVAAALPGLLTQSDSWKTSQDRFQSLMQSVASEKDSSVEPAKILIEKLPPTEQTLFLQDAIDSATLASSLLLERTQGEDDKAKRLSGKWLEVASQLSELHANLDSATLDPAKLEQEGRYDIRVLVESRAQLNHSGGAHVIRRLAGIEPRSLFASIHWLTLGDAFQKVGQVDSALFAFGKVIEQTPGQEIGLVRRAAVHTSVQDWRSAEIDLSKLLSIQPQNALAYAERARVREKLSRIEDAIEDMDHAIEVEPNWNRFYFLRSRLFRLQKNSSESRSDYERGLKLEPSLWDDWVSRALAQLPRSPEKALSDLESAEKIAPDRLEVLQNLAHVHSEYFHDLDRSLSYMKRIVQIYPDNESSLADYCVLLARLGRIEEALEAMQELESGIPRSPPTQYQMACAHALISKVRPESKTIALRYLWRSITRGYGLDVLGQDPDLDPIRSAPLFDAIQSLVRFSKETTATAHQE